MDDKIVDIYHFDDFDEEDFAAAFSDLKKFGVNDNELNLNFIDIKDPNEYSN